MLGPSGVLDHDLDPVAAGLEALERDGALHPGCGTIGLLLEGTETWHYPDGDFAYGKFTVIGFATK